MSDFNITDPNTIAIINAINAQTEILKEQKELLKDLPIKIGEQINNEVTRLDKVQEEFNSKLDKLKSFIAENYERKQA